MGRCRQRQGSVRGRASAAGVFLTRPMRNQLVMDEVDVRFPLGAGVLFALSAVVARGPMHGMYGVELLLAATVLLSVWLDAAHAMGLGVAGWAFATGFAVNSLGVLTLAPVDLLRMSGFVLLAAGASRLGRT